MLSTAVAVIQLNVEPIRSDQHRFHRTENDSANSRVVQAQDNLA